MRASWSNLQLNVKLQVLCVSSLFVLALALLVGANQSIHSAVRDEIVKRGVVTQGTRRYVVMERGAPHIDVNGNLAFGS